MHLSLCASREADLKSNPNESGRAIDPDGDRWRGKSGARVQRLNLHFTGALCVHFSVASATAFDLQDGGIAGGDLGVPGQIASFAVLVCADDQQLIQEGVNIDSIYILRSGHLSVYVSKDSIRPQLASC